MRDEDGLPADAGELRLLLHALADGELDAATAMALERRLLADPALSAEHDRIMALKEVLHRIPPPPVTDAFRARIATLGGVGANPVASANAATTAAGHPFGWRAIAASIVIAACLASGATAWILSRGMEAASQVGVADAIASGHRRSLLAASPIDIASSDRHTVKPWLDARVGLSPPAVDLAAEGFTLIGGRVEIIGNDAVPALVYRHREHLITLAALPMRPGTPRVLAATPIEAAGFSLVHWTDGAFSYWAISDMEKAELDAFVAAFRARSAGG